MFVSHAAADAPVANASCVMPRRFVALPSIAYRLARVAAPDAAGHALIRGAGDVFLDRSSLPWEILPAGQSSLGRYSRNEQPLGAAWGGPTICSGRRFPGRQ
jgi:hypothetical protein